MCVCVFYEVPGFHVAAFVGCVDIIVIHGAICLFVGLWTRKSCGRRVRIVISMVVVSERAPAAPATQVARERDHQERSNANENTTETQVERCAFDEIQEFHSALRIWSGADRDPQCRACCQETPTPQQRILGARTFVVCPVEDRAEVLELARDCAPITHRFQVRDVLQKRVAERANPLNITQALQQRRIQSGCKHRERIGDGDRVTDVFPLGSAVDRIEFFLHSLFVAIRRVRLAFPIGGIVPHDERSSGDDREHDEHEEHHDRVDHQSNAPTTQRRDRAEHGEGNDRDADRFHGDQDRFCRRIVGAHDVDPCGRAYLQTHVEHEHAAEQQHAVDRDEDEGARPACTVAHNDSLSLSVYTVEQYTQLLLLACVRSSRWVFFSNESAF